MIGRKSVLLLLAAAVHQVLGGSSHVLANPSSALVDVDKGAHHASVN